MSMKKLAILPMALMALTLTACKDSSDNKSSDDHQKDGFNVSSTGRLLVSVADTAEVSVVNLQDGSELERITLTNPASALYASPQHRYGIAIQRDKGNVQIIDGGLYQEDHGDHLHPYEKDPQLLDKTLSGSKPTHYQTNEGQAALFFDGDSEAAVMSKVMVFNDETLAHNEEASVELDNAMHGTAEPRHGGHLLTTFREADAESSLPDQVELYEGHDDHFDLVEKFEEKCPALHGSFSTEEATVFGCSDGVLVIAQDGETFTASKIANLESMAEGTRIGSFSGHVDSHMVAGWASGVLYAVDIDEATMTAVDWAHGDDVHFVAAKMDDEGEVLLVLDESGSLHLLDATNNFARLAKLDVIETLPETEGHASVAILPTPASEEVFIVDSVAKKIAVVDVEHRELKDAITLDFEPSKIAWLGIEEAHDHEGEGHEEGEHNEGESGHNH